MNLHHVQNTLCIYNLHAFSMGAAGDPDRVLDVEDYWVLERPVLKAALVLRRAGPQVRALLGGGGRSALRPQPAAAHRKHDTQAAACNGLDHYGTSDLMVLQGCMHACQSRCW